MFLAAFVRYLVDVWDRRHAGQFLVVIMPSPAYKNDIGGDGNSTQS